MTMEMMIAYGNSDLMLVEPGWVVHLYDGRDDSWKIMFTHVAI